VIWVRTAAPGLTDPEVLAWASRDERILLTFDKDFGELARGSTLPHTCGVVLLRVPMVKPADIGQRLATLITARYDWAGYFSVIEPGRVRMRRLRD
jgi:predicted nuclease of predicted toxin-antitoxin system